MDARSAHRIVVITTLSYHCTALLVIIHICFNLFILTIGARELDNCPAEPKLPIYLVVAGVAGLISKFLPILNMKRPFASYPVLLWPLLMFEFIWMICGTFWVYNLYEPNFDPSLGPYCNRDTYYVSMWVNVSHWCLWFFSLCTIWLALHMI